MSLRRIIALTALLSFIMLACTSTFIYLAPHGLDSNNWTTLGVAKHKWMALQTDLGLLFIAAGLMHLLFNIKSLMSYLKNKQGEIKIFNINVNIALLITLWAIVSSLFSLPPFSAVQHNKPHRGIQESFPTKEKVAAPEHTPKSLPPKPPLFYSGRSLERLSGTYEMNLPHILRGLHKIGIETREEWTFKQIAEHNDMEPKSVYEAVLHMQ
ncbi:MAG: DUF4405 domain-containing protein [Pontiella sp.]